MDMIYVGRQVTINCLEAETITMNKSLTLCIHKNDASEQLIYYSLIFDSLIIDVIVSIIVIMVFLPC